MCGCSWDGQLGSGSRGYCLYPSLVTDFSDADDPQHHARAANDAIVQEEEEEEYAALERTPLEEGEGGGSRSVRAPPAAATLRPRFSWERRRGGGVGCDMHSVRCDMDSRMAFNMSSACIMGRQLSLRLLWRLLSLRLLLGYLSLSPPNIYLYV